MHAKLCNAFKGTLCEFASANPLKCEVLKREVFKCTLRTLRSAQTPNVYVRSAETLSAQVQSANVPKC